jgi:hypothetical protein
MLKTFNVSLDIQKSALKNTYYQSFSFSQNDLNTIEINIFLKSNNQPFDITGSTPRIVIKKPSKLTVIQDCTIVDALLGKMKVILDTQAYCEPGLHQVELYLYEGSEVLVPGRFSYISNDAILNDKTVESNNDWQLINNALISIDESNKQINDNLNRIENADVYTKTEVNTSLGQKADTSYVDGKIGTLSSLTTTDKTNLVNAINENKTQLSDKAKQHWFNVLDYGAVKSKTLDSTSAITKCINAMSDGDVMYFPDGDYAFTNITITKDISIIGDNANLYCLSTSGIAFLNYSPVTRASYTPTSNILASDKTLVVPAGIDLSSVSVGDIVFIKSNKAYNSSPSFKQGSVLKISAINSNTLTLNSSIQYDLSTTDGVTVYVYKAFKNANVTGININLVNNSSLIGLYINCGVNITVSKCVVDGGGYNSAGVWLRMCFDSHVEKIHAKGFKDLSLSIGYGVVVSGKFITVSKCSIKDCKSSISAGDNEFTNYNILICENYSESIIGAHGSCQNVEICNNFLRFVAGTQLGVYIIINGKNFNVHHNTIVSEVVGVIDPSSAAIKCLDLSEHITIESNNIFDMQYGIKADETANIVRNNFKFKNNKMINVAYGIYMKNFSNAEIVDNRIIATNHGIWLTPTQSDFLNISNNYIEYGSSGTGNGARLENVSGGTVDKLIVMNNKLKIISSSASDGVRIFLGYISLLGTNNKFNNAAKTSAILLTSDTSTDMVKRVQNNNDGDNVVVYATATPTTGTWLKGDRVVNSSPAVGSPKAWVCTVAGTPGTWVSEGNL